MPFFARPEIALGLFVISIAFIPLNDALIKLMSAHFSIFQILAMRAIVSLAFLLAVPATVSAMRNLSFSTAMKLLLRSCCLVGAMMFFFLPLASLTLAEVTAIFYTAPLIISVMSVPVLGEKLGIFRIIAVVIGFVGVLFIVNPASDGFSSIYLMPIISAVSYSAFQLITRYLRNEAPVIAMVTFQNLIYFVFGCIGVLAILILSPQPADNAVSQFLMREWQMPTIGHLGYILVTGTIVLMLAFASSNVYSNMEATIIAPFEYAALPMAVLWGIIFLNEWPNASTWVGIAMIISGGILMIYRENLKSQKIGSSVHMRAAATNTEETKDIS